MKTKLPTAISTLKEAKEFLDELFKNNEGFHPEDDACDLVWNLPNEQIPNTSECRHLNRLMNDIYGIDGFDPCEYILSKEKS
jgi:hypothetical protein